MDIAIFQRGNFAENITKGIKLNSDFNVLVFSVPEKLPQIIDEPEKYLKTDFNADLILDYLYHPNLTDHLIEIAKNKGVQIIVPKRKVKGAITPVTCCTLGSNSSSDAVSRYSKRFGFPDMDVRIDEGKIVGVKVKKGAPCGATFVAAKKIIGTNVEDAVRKFPLEVQYLCTAKTGYDVAKSKKSPLHIAGDVHMEAIKRAIEAKNHGSSTD